MSNEITLGNSFVTKLRCNATSISALSDARDKTDVQTLSDAACLELVRRLNPVSFVWNQRDGGRVGQADMGFIAQELRDAQVHAGLHVPNLVFDSVPDRLEAAYGALLPVMMRTIQALDARLQALDARLQALEVRNP
jgi:hypothetical protein